MSLGHLQGFTVNISIRMLDSISKIWKFMTKSSLNVIKKWNRGLKNLIFDRPNLISLFKFIQSKRSRDYENPVQDTI